MGMNVLFSRLILSLLFLALLCGRPSSILGQEGSDEASISPPLPNTMKPSYKSSLLGNEISRTPTAEDEYHYAKCYLRVRVGERYAVTFLETCPVYFYSGVEKNTGGHEHENPAKPGETMTKYVPHTRGRDTVEYPDSSNQDKNFRMRGTYYPKQVEQGKEGLAFKVEASIVGQQEDLWACNRFPEPGLPNCQNHTLYVKYPGLSNFRSTLDKDNGKDHDTMVATGSKTSHPDNHYGTSTFNQKIESIAKKYYEKFRCYKKAADGSHLGYQAIGVNDMSLQYGGLFDVYNNWKTPHSSPGHAKGLAADIRVRDPKKFPKTKNSVIYDPVVINRFLEICTKEHKMNFVRRWPQYIGKENEHIHVEKR